MIDKNSPEGEAGAHDDQVRKERREFLMKAGRFAAATPPAVVVMLSVTDRAKAQVLSRRRRSSRGER